jgi:hypothetical protein
MKLIPTGKHRKKFGVLISSHFTAAAMRGRQG